MKNLKKTTTKQGVSVIIPLYNEESAAKETIEKVAHVCSTYPHEIIAVNDGSGDATASILDKLSAKNLRVIHHKRNRGYGAALKTGIQISTHEWIAITDADGTYPIEQLPTLLEKRTGADMVIGSREGSTVADTIPRKVGRGIVKSFASYVCGVKIRDINSGLRVFRKSLAEEFWHLFPNGFSFTTTITVAANSRGYTVYYTPIDYNKRKGSSTIHPIKDFVRFMTLVLRLAVYYNPLKVFTPLSLLLFLLAVIVLVVGKLYYDIILDASFTILFITSIQMFVFGLLADMIVTKLYDK